ncbi:polymorphic toxin-type HINT domain-containing protein [Streptomyces radiopugnans]|uniref:Intein C-terminal splicing region/RHS repeat-associated core domain-containing protein n=1 Tax=Streptomyces radiopugnans TaxID=403935 RepID=A0A1H9B9N7_9ACTN|nr:polymorphic toxin-type HINT domain-containing protein [Streptomyces radiopugnans]SEP85722.1 intein C-terminal splicing region/RHS repeat-associated core domain-containing protein [Streptomyces radiopugnans]
MAAVVLPVSGAVIATLLGAAPSRDFERGHSALEKPEYGKAEPFAAKTRKIHDPTVEAAKKTRSEAARKVVWPGAASETVGVPEKTTGHAEVGELPIGIAQPKAAKGAKQKRTADQKAATAPDRAEVKVLNRRETGELGIEGLVFTVARADGETGAAALGTTVDYSGFAHAYSGNWSSRLRLVRLPSCALTTPEKAACRKTTLAPSSNDTEQQAVTAQVDIPAAKAASAGTAVLALSAGTASDQGTYEATPLSVSSTWAGGGSNGDFTWNYPLDAPPTPAGPAPELSIGYSAQSVDGRTSSTSAQPSWIGEGFDLPVSYIERSYGSCEDDGQDGKYDLCWKEDNASLVLNGKSTALVKDESTGEWRPKSDDGERIVRGTGAVNGDDGDSGDKGEHWTVTTPDGTRYVFGKNRLPGWTSGKPETGSVWTVPVFGDDSGEPGHSSGTSFSGRAKTQAWRWNLDYVVDPHGNVMTYWYAKETNHYAKNGTTGNGTAYTRGGHLKRIDYGQRSDTVFSTTQPAAARVKFTVAERCIPVEGGESCSSLTGTNRNAWPDVPFDQICKADTACTDQPSPSFFTRKRLTDVTTQVYKGTGTGADTDYRDVNTWHLEQSFPDPGDGSDPGLWLKSIQQTGKVGTDAALPPVRFSGIQLHNRVDKTGDDVAPFIKWRVRTVTSETGSVLTINYSDPECVADTDMPSALDKNTKRCYPVKWIPPSNPTPGEDPEPRTDWFHKYVVTQVTESDPTGGAPLKQTDYNYHGGGAWAYDDQSPITPAKYRTWGIWRGYQKVTTTTGETSGTRSKTTALYYRGMNGDKQSDGTTRAATVTDSKGTVKTDSEQYAGQLREQITYNGTGGGEISGTINTPWSKNTATDSHSYGTVRAYMVRTATAVTRTPKSDGSELTSTVRSTYDPRSGQTLTLEKDAAGEKDCTITEYATDTTAWMLTYPKRVEKVSVGCGQTPSRTGDPKTTDVISETRTSYDGQAWGTAPTKGDTTRVERVTGYGTDGKPRLQTVSTHAYDALGRETDTWNAAGTRMRNIEYTPAAGGPLTKRLEKNALGHSVTTELIPDWGVNAVTTDANGNRTELAYDALGRLTDVWLADRTQDRAPSQKFEYRIQNTQASWVATKSLNNDGSTYQTTYTIYDALLRPRQTQAPAAVGGGRVITEIKYDTRGLETETSADYIDTTAPSGRLATLITPAPGGTQTVYDGAGRPSITKVLVNGAEYARSSHTYDGNTTTVEPPEGASAVQETADARGRLTQKLEYDGNKAGADFTRLSYSYDHADRISEVEDSDGNTWNYRYDFLGRNTGVTDPDTGTSSAEYNDLDQIIATTDAEQRTVGHTYDLIGRPTGKLEGRVPVVDGKATPDDSKYLARWTYDSIAKGQPTSAIRYVGGKAGKVYAYTHAAYDKLYRTLKEQYTISTSEGALAGTGTWTISNTYNLDGTLQKRTIPAMGGLAAEVLTYGYTEQRMPDTLQGLTGIVQNTDYLPAGERIRTTLGVSSTAKWADINTSYENGTKRLARQTVVTETGPGTASDTHYRYDRAGNPVEIEDRSTSTSDRQCFAYDGHRRLKTAWTSTTDCATAPTQSTVGGPAPYWQSFTYDSAGNRKTSTNHLASGGPATTAYGYDLRTGDKARPHLLSSTATSPVNASIPDTSHTYDKTGNTRTRTIGTETQTLDWDIENNLSKVTEADGSETSYLNDANGNRLIRRDTTGSTLYLGETELRMDKVTGKVEAVRYYGHADQTVAVRTPSSLTWLAGDHNGTASVQIDAATQAVTRRHMTPFGEQRGAAATGWIGEKGFVGGTQDPTGLTHLGAREYDPSTGRFISADPVMDLKDPQQINGYAYSNNNPVTFADPSGKFFEALARIIGAMIVMIQIMINHLRNATIQSRNSGGTTSTGTATATSAGGGGGGGGGMSCTSQLYGIGCSKEPENPGAEGSFKYLLGGIGHFLAESGEAASNFSPWCWIEDCSGATEMYDEFAEDMGVDLDSRAADSGEKAAEVASYATGIAGLARAVVKHVVKKVGKKESRPGTPNGCKCFLAGTAVLMANGATKDIEDVELGDEVLATDPETGETGPRKVVRLIVTEDDKYFNELSIATEDGIEKLTATHEHPFWSPSEKSWVDAAELKSGMTLLTDDGDTVIVTANHAYTERARTYNFTVADLHTYYALAGETPVLVHNSDCDVVLGPGEGSADALRAFTSTKPETEFVFDAGAGRFLAGDRERIPGGLSPHEQLAEKAGMDRGTVLGGTLFREDGRLVFTENSGHYGHRWTDAARRQFQKFMNDQGIEFEYRPWG